MSVDGKYHVELNGVGFVLDRRKYKSIAEPSFLPPEAMVAPSGEKLVSPFWWTKQFSDFSGGYNQLYAEAENAQGNRFLDSSGMDVSTPGEIRLMRDVASSKSLAGSNCFLVAALGNLWASDGTNVYYYNGSAWSAAVTTGVTGNIVSLIASGASMYAAGASGGIRSGTTSNWSTDFVTDKTPDAMVHFNKAIWGVNAEDGFMKHEAAGSTVVYAIPNGWAFNCIAEHNNKLAFGGFIGTAGDERSLVWESDGTAGGTSVLIDDLPNGFKIRKIQSYSDILWITGAWETTAGSATEGAIYAYTNGALQFIGRTNEQATAGQPKPNVAAAVNTVPWVIHAHGQYVYFGMNEGTGLWRYDLKEGGLSRSYTTSGNNRVTGAAWYKGKIYLSYDAGGVHAEDLTAFESSGWIKPSITTFGNSHKKLGRRIILAATETQESTNQYNADTIPGSATPAWTKTVEGTGESESVSGGILSTSSSGLSNLYYTISDASFVNATGWTIEARVQIVSAAGANQCVIGGGDDTYKCYAKIGPSYVDIHSLVGSNNYRYYMTTTDKYHVYRLTYQGTTAKLYVDGTLRVTHTVSGTGGSAIQGPFFGDDGGVSTAHSEKWDYVRYWNNGAFGPDTASWATNPFSVEATTDRGTTYQTLTADSTYLEYDLADLGLWDSLGIKLTLSDSAVVVNNIMVEAVPTLPSHRTWEMSLDLYSDMTTADGENEQIDSQAVYEALETARKNKLPVTFKDIDYDIASSAYQLTYRVLIEEMERGDVESYDQEVENIISLRLREI